MAEEEGAHVIGADGCVHDTWRGDTIYTQSSFTVSYMSFETLKSTPQYTLFTVYYM